MDRFNVPAGWPPRRAKRPANEDGLDSPASHIGGRKIGAWLPPNRSPLRRLAIGRQALAQARARQSRQFSLSQRLSCRGTAEVWVEVEAITVAVFALTSRRPPRRPFLPLSASFAAASRHSVALEATSSPPPSRGPVRGRLDGRADSVFPTAPHAFQQPSTSTGPSAFAAHRTVTSSSQQPGYLGHPLTPPAPAVTAAAGARNLRHPQNHLLQSPFRSRAAAPATVASYRPRRLSAARLWNPTNSTPRVKTRRNRRPSTPPPPAVPLQHPVLDDTADNTVPTGAGAGDYPLLTLSEQRQTRHSLSARASLQVDRRGSSDHRVSLPPSVRASYDGKRSQSHTPTPLDPQARVSTEQNLEEQEPAKKLDKGKGRAIMPAENEDTARAYSRDLERGPDVMDHRLSNVSLGDGIGSQISSSNSSIMGEDVQADAGDEWGPLHACFPHLNQHVPVDSLEYATTRIIRVRRDWLVKGDLAPTFSDLYPEILDPAGISEPEFRRVIEKLNSELVPVFDPYNFRNIMDGVLGLVTGWMWDDLGLTGIKSRLNGLEKWIEQWNQEMEKTMAPADGIMAPKIMPLRRTGYMTLDIQIPDPEIEPAPSSRGPNESGTALPLEPAPVVTV